jgi:hypothetical protein
MFSLNTKSSLVKKLEYGEFGRIDESEKEKIEFWFFWKKL